MTYPAPLQKLIAHLRKFPGVGKKTAERFAFQLLSWKDGDLSSLAHLLSTIKKELHTCSTCHAVFDRPPCPYCDLTRRDARKLCIVASTKDLFTLESTGIYNGLYHVIQGLLSPLDDRGPDSLRLDLLKERLVNLPTKEIILAIDSTLEGDATSLFLKKEFEQMGLSVSRLAMGMPLGSSLDYLDEGTLARAFSSRSFI